MSGSPMTAEEITASELNNAGLRIKLETGELDEEHETLDSAGEEEQGQPPRSEGFGEDEDIDIKYEFGHEGIDAMQEQEELRHYSKPDQKTIEGIVKNCLEERFEEFRLLAQSRAELQAERILFEEEKKNEMKKIAKAKEQLSKLTQCVVRLNRISENTKVNVVHHMKNPKNFERRCCGRVFKSKQSICNHRRSYCKNQKPKLFCCEICKKEYKGKRDLNKHMEKCGNRSIDKIN